MTLSSGCPEARLDIVFVLDASSSVGTTNFDEMKDFVKDFLLDADIDKDKARVGVIIYSTSEHVMFQMNHYHTKADVFKAVDNIKYITGVTNTAGALKTMRENMFSAANGDRPGVKNIAIVVTDGMSNVNPSKTVPEANDARANNIEIFAIGVGLSGKAELIGIAGGKDHQCPINDFKGLVKLRKRIFALVCQ